MSWRSQGLSRGGRWRWLWPVVALIWTTVAWPPAPVAAHESREILAGKYQLRVGFLEEPAYQGLLNGLYLAICTGKCMTDPASGTFTNGVVGAFETVKVEVTFGGQSMPLKLIPVPRNPGRYQAQFVPTRAGDYTFRIYGAIGGDQFDERFTSSPTTFDTVQPATAVQFPDKPGFPTAGAAAAPAPAGPARAPTAGAQGTPIPAAAPPAVGVGGAIGAAELQVLREQLRDQQQQLALATASVASARLLALAGLVVGCLGGLMGGVAVVLAGRAARTLEPAQPESPEDES